MESTNFLFSFVQQSHHLPLFIRMQAVAKKINSIAKKDVHRGIILPLLWLPLLRWRLAPPLPAVFPSF